MTFGLDIAAGVALWTDELYGDWYRDPWAWPERKWLQRSGSKFDVRQYVGPQAGGLINVRVRPYFHLLDIPKSRLGVRPAVLQDPLSRLLYLSAIGPSIGKMHHSVPEFVYGWRSRGGSAHPNDNASEWASYMERVRQGRDTSLALQTDITSYFASIEIDRLEEELRQRFGKVGPIDVIHDILREHDSLHTRSGLPQRSFGSAILANFFLQPLDECIMRALKVRRIFNASRWMDDIVCFGEEASLYETNLDIQQEMRALGLEANTAKSFLLEPEAAINSIDLEQGKKIDIRWRVGPKSGEGRRVINPKDLAKVRRIEDRILADAGTESRPRLKRALVSLIAADRFRRHSEWLDAARKIPHAADALGRYLRAAAQSDNAPRARRWPELQEWLLDFLGQPWARIPWVKAQLMLTVPTEHLRKPLLQDMEGWLENSTDVQLLAVAAQRLAVRSPKSFRSIVSTRADSIGDPLLQRVLCLAVLNSGQNRALARRLAKAHDANVLLRVSLEDENWSAPPVARDFDNES